MDEWVCAAGQLLDDVTPLLDAALLADTPASRRNLYHLYDWNRRDVEKRGRLTNAFWEHRAPVGDERAFNPNVARIVAWFRRPDVAEAVDLAYTEAAQNKAEGQAVGEVAAIGGVLKHAVH